MVKKRFFERTILDWAIAVLLIQIFMTILFAYNPEFSRPKIFGVLFTIFFFYAIVALLSTETLIKFSLLFFLGGGLILSVFSIVNMNWYPITHFNKIIPEISEYIPKINWNLPGAERGINPNALAGILILVFPLSVLLLLSNLKGKEDNRLISNKLFSWVVYSVSFCLMGSIVFFTQSKGGWTGLLVGMWILFLSWKSKKRSLLLFLLIAILIFSFTIIRPASLINEIKTDISVRKPWLVVGIQTVSDHPIVGIGLNWMRKTSWIDSTHVHNHFLNTAAELGIPALVAYLSILIGAGYMSYQIWLKSNIVWIRTATKGLACGQLAHLIFGIGDSIPLGAKPGIFFWFSLGLIASMYNFTMKSQMVHGGTKNTWIQSCT